MMGAFPWRVRSQRMEWLARTGRSWRRARTRRSAVALVPVPLYASGDCDGTGPKPSPRRRRASYGGATADCGLRCFGSATIVLIERTAKPHNKVCGEFLSVETQTLIAAVRRRSVVPLGAVPVEQVAVSACRKPQWTEISRAAGPWLAEDLDGNLALSSRQCAAGDARKTAAQD